MSTIHKYLAVFRLTFLQAAKNHNMLIGLAVFTITCLLIFSHLWQVAAAKTTTAPIDPILLLWYIALNEWVIISIPDIHNEMQQELQSGSLAYSIIRPVSYLLFKFSEGFAHLVLHLLVLGVVTFTFTYLWTDFMPFSLAQSVVMLFLGLMAGVIGLLFQMLVGLSSFWLQDVTPFAWVWEKMLFVFGGLILPLFCYPTWLQTIAQYTPFPAILGGRSGQVFDQSSDVILQLLFSVTFWIAMGVILLNVVFKRAMKILNVQGG